MLIGGTEASKFSVDGVNGSICDGSTVSDAGITQGCLVVLVGENFLGEELFEFKPSTRFVRFEVSFSLVTGFVHMRQLEKMSKRGAHHGDVRNWFWRFLEEGTSLLLALEVLGWCEGILVGLIEVS